jgi:hypothetical protein
VATALRAPVDAFELAPARVGVLGAYGGEKAPVLEGLGARGHRRVVECGRYLRLVGARVDEATGLQGPGASPFFQVPAQAVEQGTGGLSPQLHGDDSG